MAGLQKRSAAKIGPSDTSDTYSDRPNEPEVDTDDGGTGERVTVGRNPHSELHNERGADRVVEATEAGLGGGLDQAEEAQLGVTDEEPEEGDEDAADEGDADAPGVRTPKP